MNQPVNTNIQAKIDEDLSPTKRLTGFHLKIVSAIAIIWSFFQLWYASPFPFMFDFGMFKGLPARAIHLGFALLLAFLVFPTFKRGKVNFIDIMIGIIGISCCLYIYFFYDDLIDRGGVLHILKYNNYSIPIELIIGSTGILILLEATRRVIGIPLVVIAVCFLLFSYYGQYAPEIISHGGLSLKRLVGFQWFDQEAIFGIPIGVSVDFIFLFVLFGAFLETAGGGKYFLDLAFAMVGKTRGGPAKAAILGSGMTGMISGSSVANTVTTGTFTIPIMKQTGFSKEKAGAIEVASSVNGQIMPPVMGAAAFVMASFIGVTYFEIVKHAFLPAIISYIALFYISHLEALKLGLKGIEKDKLYFEAATKRIKNSKIIKDEYLDTIQNNRSKPRIPFGSLVELGAIKPGTEIYDQKKKINAKIMVDGSIKYQKSEGSIHKIAAKILGAPSIFAAILCIEPSDF